MFGKQIVEIRKKFNLTQAQLGKKLNVSPQAVSKWERDLSEPDLATVKKISQLFHISLNEFFDIESLNNENLNNQEEINLNENKSETINNSKENDTNSNDDEFSSTQSVIGSCANCGIQVYSNSSENTNIILCEKCATVTKRQKLVNKLDTILYYQDLLEKKLNKTLFYGMLFPLIIMIIAILNIVNAKYNVENKTAVIAILSIFAVILTYVLISVIINLSLKGPLTNIQKQIFHFPSIQLKKLNNSLTEKHINQNLQAIICFFYKMLAFTIGYLLSFVAGIIFIIATSPFVLAKTIINSKKQIDEYQVQFEKLFEEIRVLNVKLKNCFN